MFGWSHGRETVSHAGFVSVGLVVTVRLPLTPALSHYVDLHIEHEQSGLDSQD